MVSLVKGKHTLSLGGEFALDKTMFWADLLNFGTISFATSAPTSTSNVFSDWVTGQASSFEQDTPYTTLISYLAHCGVRAGQLPDHTPVHSKPWNPLGHRYGSRRVPEQDGIVRSRRAIHRDAGRAEGHVVPGGPGRRSRHNHHEIPSYCATCRFCMGPVWGRQNRISRRRGRLLRHHQRQRVEPARQRRTVRHTSDLRSLNSITNIYSTPGDFPSTAPGGGIFPYVYSPSAPKFFPTAAVESIDKNAQYPYIYQFNTSVQRQLPAQVSLTVAYVGTLSHNVPTMIDGNYAPYSTAFGTPCTGAQRDLRRRPDRSAASVRSLCRDLSKRSGRHQHWHHGTEHLSDHKPARQLQRPSSLGEEAVVAWLHYQRFLCLEPRATKLKRVGDWTDDRAEFRLLRRSLHRHQQYFGRHRRRPRGGKGPDGC